MITYLACKHYIDRILISYNNFSIGINTWLTCFFMHAICFIAFTDVFHCHLPFIPLWAFRYCVCNGQVPLYLFITYISLKYHFCVLLQLHHLYEMKCHLSPIHFFHFLWEQFLLNYFLKLWGVTWWNLVLTRFIILCLHFTPYLIHKAALFIHWSFSKPPTGTSCCVVIHLNKFDLYV